MLSRILGYTPIQILIVPCFEENSKSHWYKQLRKSLWLFSIKVTILDMPTPEQPKANEWVSTLQNVIDDPGHTIIIGHSIGAVTALLVAAELINEGKKLGGLVLVSPARSYNHPSLSRFGCYHLDFDVIGKSTEILQVSGIDDPHVPINETLWLYRHLHTTLLSGAFGHMGKNADGEHTRELPLIVTNAIEGFVRNIRCKIRDKEMAEAEPYREWNAFDPLGR